MGGRGTTSPLPVPMETTLTNLSDEEVLARSVAEPDLFSVLLDRYQSAFIRKAESILRLREEAEDAVQDTFTKIYIAAPRFTVTEGASFKSWAYRILLNTVFTRYQKRKRDWSHTAALDPEIYEMLPDLESRTAERAEVSEYILSVLVRLPENFARVLELHFLEGKPQKEIAEMENLSVGAVKTRIHRAKEEFRKVAGTLVV